MSESAPMIRRPAMLAMATTETAVAASDKLISSSAVPKFEATPMMYRPTMQSIKNMIDKSQYGRVLIAECRSYSRLDAAEEEVLIYFMAS